MGRPTMARSIHAIKLYFFAKKWNSQNVKKIFYKWQKQNIPMTTTKIKKTLFFIFKKNFNTGQGHKCSWDE